MSALEGSGSLRTKPTFRDATTGSDVILRGIKPEVETQNIGCFVRLRIRLIVSFFFLIFVYIFKLILWNASFVFLRKAGMTAKTRQKRQPVRTTLIVVSHKKENLRARKRQFNSLPKDAPLHHYAGWANWTANRPTPQRKSPNAKSTAVKVICAMETTMKPTMEPKYQ